jgi:hypothetical protein
MGGENPFKDDPEYLELQEWAKLEAQREANDWHNVMKEVSGKRVIIQLMQYCGHMQTIFDKHNSEMCRKTGKAEVGFFIQNKLAMYTPDALLEIMTNASNLFANDN